jgi:hypothetical protein
MTKDRRFRKDGIGSRLANSRNPLVRTVDYDVPLKPIKTNDQRSLVRSTVPYILTPRWNLASHLSSSTQRKSS